MPHIAIKMMPGRNDAQKQKLAEALVRTTMEVIGATEDLLSVTIEDIPGPDWDAKVFAPDIAGKKDKLFKKPGYKQV